LQAVQGALFPGKVIVSPNVQDLSLTALPDLEDRLPSAYAKLKDGHEWTNEAEAELICTFL
jgi:hypothetical protein